MRGHIAYRDGRPVPQATVAVMGTAAGTHTDNYSHYSLSHAVERRPPAETCANLDYAFNLCTASTPTT